MLETRPVGFNQAEFLINADAIRRDNSKGYMLVYKDAMEKLKHTDPLRYKDARKKYRAARYLYRKYSFLTRETEEKIRLIHEGSPELIVWLSQMRAASGGDVFAYIGSKVRFSSKESLGDTHIRFEEREKKAQLAIKIEIEQDLLLLAPQPNAVKITLATDADLHVCRHELGHYAYIVIEPDSYYHFLTEEAHRQSGDGHLHNDPSGVLADAFEHKHY
ncbi:MAG: hypothetical protein AAF696_29785 [Bacteroidota bacterium]